MVGGVSWQFVDRWRLQQMLPERAVITLYHRLYRLGWRLAVPVWPGNTPHKFSEALLTQVQSLIRGNNQQTALESTTQEIEQLTQLYMQTVYSNQHPTSNHQQHAIQQWQHLRRRLWLARVKQWLRIKG